MMVIVTVATNITMYNHDLHTPISQKTVDKALLPPLRCDSRRFVSTQDSNSDSQPKRVQP